MTWCVNLLTGTGDGPASVESFQTNHHTREIFDDGHVAARYFLHRSYAGVFVIDRPEKIGAQQLDKFPRIDAVAFVADFQQRTLPSITNQHFRDMGLEQDVHPSRASAV